METFYQLLIFFLIINIGVAMLRVIRGPTRADRLMTAQLFGTTGVAILLLLAELLAMPALRDVALLFVLLATVLIIAFVRTTPPETSGEDAV
jgi:multicomponent Na+:H+ antiporter subunit F